MNGKTAYLLLQSIQSETDFAFSSSLTKLIQEELEGSPYFMLDNLSDSTMISYAKRFIDETEKVIIICEKVESNKLGSWLPVLNYSMKKPHVSLITLGGSGLMAPFIKMKKAEAFMSEGELRKYLRNRNGS